MARDRSTKIRFKGTIGPRKCAHFADTDGDEYTITAVHRKKRKRRDIYLEVEELTTGSDIVGMHLHVSQVRTIIQQLQRLVDEIEPPVVDTTPHIDDLDNIDQTLVDIQQEEPTS